MTQHLTGATRLLDWGVIRAEGEDAAKFLHSQLTQDFALLGPDQARFAGFCSAKGRLLATLIAWKPDAGTVLLALPLELLPAIQKRLSMFVLRAKCKLSDASSSVALWGALGSHDARAPWTLERHGDAAHIRLPDNGTQGRWLIAQPPDAPAPATALAEGDWAWSQLEAGLPTVLSATTEQFVPQMLNLELLGGVNFQKGCYPGQEVVARSQYRGTLKRRTYLYELAGEAHPGQEIFHSEDPGQPAGLVTNAAARSGRSLVLAETKIAALANGSLHLGAPDGPLLTSRPLPYPLTEPQ
ncbi:MAG: folate-binding protein YgfZ [Paucibacter sp.]|nr:folate-binding protein YgfZ [Roseateles sp.]